VDGYSFTENVRRVLAASRDAANDLHHEYVGTEHILLGLLREGDGVAHRMLEALMVDSDRMRHKILDTVQQGRSPGAVDLPYTSRAKKVLELAMNEARTLHHEYVGTEHLLLGLAVEAKGIAAQVLTDAGFNKEAGRAALLSILASPTAPPRPAMSPGRRAAGLSVPGLSSAQDHHVDTRVPSRVFKIFAASFLVAERLRRRAINADHVMLALLEHGEGTAIAVLEKLGVSPSQLHRDLGIQLGSSDHAMGPETMIDARGLNDLLAKATREQVATGSPALSTWHLLLAVLAADGFASADVLAEAGVTRDKVVAEATRISG